MSISEFKAVRKPDRAERSQFRGSCRECGREFTASRATCEFCSVKCRGTFHNRRASRGADAYDVLMELRFNRAAAEAAGAWSLLCRMAAEFRREDERDRAGRQSWDDLQKVKQRNARLTATIVAMDIAGRARRGVAR